MRSPLLFLVFNRPAPTARVFETIRAAKPQRLYVAADGPRTTRAGEAEQCALTRQVVMAVDWDCKVQTLFRDENLGCKQAVSRAIDWFFEHEEEGIILEDDCLPVPSFFRFCDEMLERYRSDPRVGLVSGDNFQFGREYGSASYYFTRYAHIWGWASWRRAWLHYDRDARIWPAFRDAGGLQRVFGSRRAEIQHWRAVLDDLYAGKIDTWDHQLNLTLWSQGMVSVVPQRNLIRNIGFGEGATHTKSVSKFADMAVKEMEFPLRHPTSFETCSAADDYTAAQAFVKPLAGRMVGKLKAACKRLLVQAGIWKFVTRRLAE
jgi:hypothetical protein